MPPSNWALAQDAQAQRDKLANSYQELLNEFGSKDLRNVGNYSVGRLIGKGSFGKVYLASHRLTNGSKVVLKSAKKDDQNLAREIHHHRQFIHPHIARLYEVIVTENLVWLVLEWCPGDELYNHLLNHGRMEEANVQRIFTQLVGAVTYVHNKGCVHRDLKLENILLDKNGNVKLVDFGFTREYSGSTSYLQTWCGTVAYSAPEMIKGEKYGGEKVDVWSLGVILYALLVGELPFDDDDDNVTKNKIMNEDLTYPEYYPAAAKELTQKLLSKRPLLRPSLPDILKHSWLAEHAPQQQETLKLERPPPFATQLEQDTLARMRSAGVDIEMVVDHVLGQRCDGLAGWWALLIEKEERKAKRRERRRKEKEAEEKALKRLSAASTRLLGPGLSEINEEGGGAILLNSPKPRGRHISRGSGSHLSVDHRWSRLDMVADQEHLSPDISRPVVSTPPEARRRFSDRKDPARSTSSTRRRPVPPPKEFETLTESVSRHDSTTVPADSELPVNTAAQKRKKLYQQTLRSQLATIKAWFRDSSKKSKGTNAEYKSDGATNGTPSRNAIPVQPRRSSTAQILEIRKAELSSRPGLQTRSTVPARPRVTTASSYGSTHSSAGIPRGTTVKRLSMSPQSMTPRSNSFRRRSGLGGRKSTSSSVSSVRSIHIHHPSGISHTRASSTSSAAPSVVASPNLSNPPGSRGSATAGSNIKILPPSPSTITLPPSIRVQRRGPPGLLGSLPTFADAQSSGGGNIGPSSPGMHAVFARQKRKVFKGPSIGGGGQAHGTGPRNRSATPTSLAAPTSSSGAARDRSRNRQSVEIVGASSAVVIVEEEEEEPQHAPLEVLVTPVDGEQGRESIEQVDEDMEEEEVDEFSPAEEHLGPAGGEDGYFKSVHEADIQRVQSHGSVVKGVGFEDGNGDGRLHMSVERKEVGMSD